MAKEPIYDASSITVLEGLEAVRKRPGMYIGSVSTKGLNHLIYEIVDNSVDEHLAGYCDTIKVTLEADGSATIEDNGRGIPVGMHEKGVSAERLVFTTLHAGGKFDNSAYKTSGGLHGVGSSVVNALSTYMTVRIKNGGNLYAWGFISGSGCTCPDYICLRIPVLLCTVRYGGKHGNTSGGGFQCAERIYASNRYQLAGLLFGCTDGKGKCSCHCKKYSVYDSVLHSGRAFDRYGQHHTGNYFNLDFAGVCTSVYYAFGKNL